MDLKALRVPLEEVAEAMDAGPQSPMVIDLTDGSVLPEEALRMAIEEGEEGLEAGDGDELEERALHIPTLDAREAIALRERFIETVRDPPLRRRLEDALAGRGAFSRFREALRSGGPERDRFFAFVRAELADEARRWLESEGVGYAEHTPRPAMALVPEEADVGLLDVLVLGGPGGKTELVGGFVPRSVSARNREHASALLRRLASEACALQGLPWSEGLLKARGPVQVGRVRLTARGNGVDVDVATTMDLWRRFGD